MKLELQNRKNQKIVGVLSGKDTTAKGTCILMHGYSGYKEQDHLIAMQNVFLDNGFQTFNFDATNSFGESEGEFEKSTLGLHFEDFEDVANWVLEQDWFVAPLAIIGHSMGGYAVARYAQENNDTVEYCLSIAPVVAGKFTLEAHKESNPEEYEEWKRSGWLRIISTNGRPRVRNQPWSHMVERLDHDLLPNANMLTMPLFLYVGGEDTTSTPKHVKLLYAAIPDGNKSMVVAEGVPHTYESKTELKHLSTNIDNWLKNNVPQ